MDQSVEVLFKLIRVALGDEIDYLLPNDNDVDWEEMFNLSLKQDVVNLAYDGLQNLLCARPEMKSHFCKPKWEELRYKWLGYRMVAEQRYETYSKIVSDLADLYSSHDYQMLLLKGYGLSLYYPIPSHRSIGDIDISVMRQGQIVEHVQADADRFLQKELGMIIEKSKKGHHSHFTYKNILVENHYEYSNTYFGTSKEMMLESILQSLAKENRKSIAVFGKTIYLPSSTFSAIFLMWHMSTHFCASRLSLRQLCDWRQFLVAEYKNVDWPYVNDVYKKCGLELFSKMINGLLVRYLGMDLDYFNDYYHGLEYDDRVINDMFSIKEYNTVLSRIKRFPSFGWKFRMVYQSHWLGVMIRSSFLHLFQKDDLIEKEV